MNNENIVYGLPNGCTNDEKAVIAASPLVKQPATMPYRIVMVAYLDGRYSIHTEQFPYGEDGQSNLSNGFYFPAGAVGFTQALRKFAERIEYHAEYFATCFRS